VGYGLTTLANVSLINSPQVEEKGSVENLSTLHEHIHTYSLAKKHPINYRSLSVPLQVTVRLVCAVAATFFLGLAGLCFHTPLLVYRFAQKTRDQSPDTQVAFDRTFKAWASDLISVVSALTIVNPIAWHFAFYPTIASTQFLPEEHALKTAYKMKVRDLFGLHIAPPTSSTPCDRAIKSLPDNRFDESSFYNTGPLKKALTALSLYSSQLIPEMSSTEDDKTEKKWKETMALLKEIIENLRNQRSSTGHGLLGSVSDSIVESEISAILQQYKEDLQAHQLYREIAECFLECARLSSTVERSQLDALLKEIRTQKKIAARQAEVARTLEKVRDLSENPLHSLIWPFI